MKWFGEAGGTLKAARWLELLAVVVLLAVMGLLLLDGGLQTDSGATADERRMENILARVEGAGNVSVMMRPAPGEDGICGIVIVADGAKNPLVLLKLQQAARILTGLELEQIEIFASES